VSVVDTAIDPGPPWQAALVGSHYVVRRDRPEDAVAGEVATGSSTLALVFDKSDAEALAVALNAAQRR